MMPCYAQLVAVVNNVFGRFWRILVFSAVKMITIRNRYSVDFGEKQCEYFLTQSVTSSRYFL